MNWLVLASLTALGFGIYNFFLKIAADKINPILATAVLTLASAVFAGLAILTLRTIGFLPDIHWTKDGLKFAILAGLSAGIADILFFFLFSKGFPLNIGLPFVFTLTVVIAVLLSTIFLHESLTPIRLIGITIALIGVFILSRF